MLSAKSLDQRILRLEFLVSTLMHDRDQLMEYINAERQQELIHAQQKQSTDAHDARDRSRSQTQEWTRPEQESGEGVRSSGSRTRQYETP